MSNDPVAFKKLCLRPRELEYCLKRRRKIREKFSKFVSESLMTAEEGRVSVDPTALALSGGGIRSATLSLGVLTALSQKKLIHKLDFLSTVSGGSYTGGFYGSLFVDPNGRRARDPEGVAGGEAEKWPDPSLSPDPLGTDFGEAAIRYLRNNGRYLLSDAGDTIRLIIITIRNWIAVQLVIGLTLLAICLFIKALQASAANADWVRALDSQQAEQDRSTIFWIGEWVRGYPLGDTILLSWLWPFAMLFLAGAVMAGWAFWVTRLSFVPKRRWLRPLSGGFLGSLTIAAICLLSPKWIRVPSFFFMTTPLYYVTLTIGVLAIGGAVFYLVAEWRGSPKTSDEELDPSSDQEGRVRTILTNYAARWLGFALVFAVAATLDSAAQTFYRLRLWDRGSATLPLTGAALAAALTPFIRSFLEWAQTSGPSGPNVRRYGRLFALAIALLFALALGVFWATMAEYIAWRGGAIGGDLLPIQNPKAVDWSIGSVWFVALCFGLIAITIGMSPGFLNLSTFGNFYAARLRRAYLGASNPTRTTGQKRTRIEMDDPGDEISIGAYYHKNTGAPLHIINITLNETTGRNGSALVRHDRKGRPLTVSPAGYLVDGEELA